MESSRQSDEKGLESSRQSDEKGMESLKQSDEKGMESLRQSDEKGMESLRQSDEKVHDGAEIENGVVEEGCGNQLDETMIEPHVGMVFSHMDEIDEMYMEFAKRKGFSVNRLSGKKDQFGDYTYITFGCHRGRKANNRSKSGERKNSTRRMDCKARVCASRQRDGSWKVNRVHLEHNHELTPGQSGRLHVKRQLGGNDKAGMRPCKTFRAMVVGAGGHETIQCSERECINHLDKVRKMQLGKDDAEAIHQLFVKMQQRDRNFFYAISFDKAGRTKNIIWVDSRCQAAYKEFGIVISFDTTYLVNKYQMPFAPFIGMNHHGQSTLLGCALLCNEKVSSFIWVFEQWLRCMGGLAPQGIITDQCTNVGNAIEAVFPASRHRWCLWNIMSKFSERMKKYEKYSEIKEFFDELVFDSVSTEEFELRWGKLLENYELQSNSWLGSLYEDREKWAPVCIKRYFWAGLSSTQRSENMHSYFNGYVHTRSTLKQFVDQYDAALMDKIEKEMQADIDSVNTKVATCSEYKIEKQLNVAYTHGIYQQVQKEFLNMMYCNVTLVKEANENLYKVESKVFYGEGESKRISYVVKYDTSQVDVRCSCLLFESKGILCSHCLCVLTKNDVDELPSKYVLSRWRKDLKRYHSNVKPCLFSAQLTEDSRRKKQMGDIFIKVANIACASPDMSSYVCRDLEGVLQKLENWEGGCRMDAPATGGSTEEMDQGRTSGGQSFLYIPMYNGP